MFYVSIFSVLVKTRFIAFFLTSLFFLAVATTSHATLVDIPDVIKAEVPAPELNVKSWILADFETGAR